MLNFPHASGESTKAKVIHLSEAVEWAVIIPQMYTHNNWLIFPLIFFFLLKSVMRNSHVALEVPLGLPS